MYIKKEDYEYLRTLINSLNDSDMHDFMDRLLAAGKEKSGAEISKIKVIDDSLHDVQAIDPSEMVTRIMIKKAYKAVKEGKKG